jgi:transposase
MGREDTTTDLRERMALVERQLAKLIDENAALFAEREALREDNVALREDNVALREEIARLKRNSSNSSKPPSSDIVKPPKKKPARKRGRKRKGKPGAQRGHEASFRKPFEADEIDCVEQFRPSSCCSDCGGPVIADANNPVASTQSVERVEQPVFVTEYQVLEGCCARCGKTHRGEMPQAVRRQGLFGPRLSALVGQLKGTAHASYTVIQRFLGDVCGVDVSRGFLAKLVSRLSDALAPAHDELCARLPRESRLNIDETGHKDNGALMWTWCFRAPDYTLFQIDPSRGSQVLVAMLGEAFAGIIGCDFFSAYRKYMREHNVLGQLCLAHFIREVRFLAESGDKVTANYGNKLLDALKQLFRVFHRRDDLTDEAFQKQLAAARDQVLKVGKSGTPRDGPRKLAKRLKDYGKQYFRFVTTPDTEPTNNLAEQAIRFVVIDRKVTQGTRGQTGQRWSERIWTTMATCAQRGTSVYRFLCDALTAPLHGLPPPSLLSA